MVPVATLSVTAPLPLPDAGERVNQAALLLAIQVRVPAPVLLMLSVWAAGLVPVSAVNDKLAGLAPIAGLVETTGSEGAEMSCANPGISAANLLIDRPPVFPFPEVEELPLPLPGAASGIVPVADVPVAMDPLVVAGGGATLMVAIGTAAPTLLLSDDDSVD